MATTKNNSMVESLSELIKSSKFLTQHQKEQYLALLPKLNFVHLKEVKKLFTDENQNIDRIEKDFRAKKSKVREKSLLSVVSLEERTGLDITVCSKKN